jgi:hypothetical protein
MRWVWLTFTSLKALLLDRAELAAENLALRQPLD